MAHLQGSNVEMNFVDKRKALSAKAEPRTHVRIKSVAVFTANGAGSTTTIVGANAAPGTNDSNTIRRGDEFVLYNTGGVLKEETVFTVTNIAVAGSTTVTFSPAAAGATASGDFARFVGTADYKDEADLDARLTTLGGWYANGVNVMNQNDKIFALRTTDDPEGI
jgi:hypothetical protein